MRVVVPDTRWHPEVAAALDQTGYAWERVDVSASDESYWELLDEFWRDGNTFVIVEHDVVVGPDTLSELEACEADWCSWQLPYVGTVWAGLGCIKLTAALIARQPDAIETISHMSDSTHPAKHFCRLDAWLQGTLTAGGERKCTHGPPLEHLRDYAGPPQPSHDCGRA